MSESLKSCPFCGARAGYVTITMGGIRYGFVKHDAGCFLNDNMLYGETEQRIDRCYFNAWNERADDE